MEDQEPRLTMRVLSLWRNLCQGTMPPRRSQIDPIIFGPDWANCLLVDLDPKLEHSRLSYVGNNVRDPSWPPLDRQTLADCEDSTLLHATLATAARVIAKGLPISSGGMVAAHGGEAIVYRSILLPLAETNGRVDGLLGAASFRVLAVEQEIHTFDDRLMARPQLVSGLRG